MENVTNKSESRGLFADCGGLKADYFCETQRKEVKGNGIKKPILQRFAV